MKNHAFWQARLKQVEAELEEARLPLEWLERLPDSPADMRPKTKLEWREWIQVRNRWANRSRTRAAALRKIEKLEKRRQYILEQLEACKPVSVWVRLRGPSLI